MKLLLSWNADPNLHNVDKQTLKTLAEKKGTRRLCSSLTHQRRRQSLQVQHPKTTARKAGWSVRSLRCAKGVILTAN